MLTDDESNLYRGYSMKNQVNWRRLSVAVLASLALTSPVYAAEVSHSQEVELGGHKTAAKEGQRGVGTIEVDPAEQPAVQSGPDGNRYRSRGRRTQIPGSPPEWRHLYRKSRQEKSWNRKNRRSRLTKNSWKPG